MAIGEQLRQHGYGATDLAFPDGFLWGRLVTGVFAVAISLTMSWPAGQVPVELPRTEAPRPKHEQLAAADLLDRRDPEIARATTLHETLSPPAEPPAQAARKPPQRAPDSPKRHRLQRTSAQAKAQSGQLAQRKTGVKPRSHSHQVARAKLTRTRSAIRREYIAAREQVAALTSEDSGSAYLARLAARRQNAVRTNLADHSHRRNHAGRETLARS